MHIDVIDTAKGLSRIKSDWDHVYRADPESQFFLSWTWLKRWLDGLDGTWLILAAKPSPAGERHVAFLPLRRRTKMRASGGFYNELTMAGSRMAEYTGLLAHPAHATEAVRGFAQCLKRMSWARLDFDKLRMSASRIEMLIEGLDAAGLSVRRVHQHRQHGIDLYACPYIPLPASWEAYLGTLSANTRQRIRRGLRKLDASPELRIVPATNDTIERDLDPFLALWTAKWAARKGKAAGAITSNLRLMLLHCMRAGALYMPLLWQDERLVAGLALLVDADKKTLLFMVGGRDPGVVDPPPGLMLHAFSIRRAIEMGFAEYDFLNGDETYKLSLAGERRQLESLTVAVPGGLNHDGRLDPACCARVQRYCDKLRRGGQWELAAVGYRQILGIDPANASVAGALQQMAAARGAGTHLDAQRAPLSATSDAFSAGNDAAGIS